MFIKPFYVLAVYLIRRKFYIKCSSLKHKNLKFNKFSTAKMLRILSKFYVQKNLKFFFKIKIKIILLTFSKKIMKIT
jgi:hypothetical protein